MSGALNPKKSINFRQPFEKTLKDAGIEDFTWHDLRHSCASYLAMIIGAFAIFVGILPAIFLKEKMTAPGQLTREEAKSMGIKDFFTGFLATIKFTPFLCLCAATFLVFNGFMMVANFQAYVIIYYVFVYTQDVRRLNACLACISLN